MIGLVRDLAALLRNPRSWWFNATHAPCPVCGAVVDVAEWFQHRDGHDTR